MQKRTCSTRMQKIDTSCYPHPAREEASARGRRAAYDAACLHLVPVCDLHGFVRIPFLFFFPPRFLDSCSPL